jgi:hypothetical protein
MLGWLRANFPPRLWKLLTSSSRLMVIFVLLRMVLSISLVGLVGVLQYLTITRPDISFSVNRACQFLHAPTTSQSHCVVVKRILRYVSLIVTFGLQLQASLSSEIYVFSDAE